MAWLVSALGALLAVGGGYALWNGSGYIRLDWGQAETVAGTVALSGGIVTLAVAALLFTLRDLARAPALAGAAAARAPMPAPAAPVPEPIVGFDEPEPPRAPAPRHAELPPREPLPREPAPPPALPAAAPEPAVDAPTVVGRYEANGASYVLFSDGTIEVETEHGTHRFASMAALKDHIEGQDAG